MELTSERLRPLEAAAPASEAPGPPRRRRRPGGRLPASTVLGIVISLAIVAPLLVVPLSLIGDGFAFDPIDVERAGPLLADAVALMQRVGWK